MPSPKLGIVAGGGDLPGGWWTPAGAGPRGFVLGLRGACRPRGCRRGAARLGPPRRGRRHARRCCATPVSSISCWPAASAARACAELRPDWRGCAGSSPASAPRARRRWAVEGRHRRNWRSEGFHVVGASDILARSADAGRSSGGHARRQAEADIAHGLACPRVGRARRRPGRDRAAGHRAGRRGVEGTDALIAPLRRAAARRAGGVLVKIEEAEAGTARRPADGRRRHGRAARRRRAARHRHRGRQAPSCWTAEAIAGSRRRRSVRLDRGQHRDERSGWERWRTAASS